MLTLEQLLAIDPHTAPDDTFDGWLSGGHPDLAPVKRRPVTAHVTELHDRAYALGGQARGLANAARTALHAQLNSLAPTAGGHVDVNREQERAERDQLRVWIAFAQYFAAILAAEPANRRLDGENQRWPALPVLVKRSATPMWKDDSGYKPFSIGAWCSDRADRLCSDANVRIMDHDRQLHCRAGAWSEEELKVMQQYQPVIAGWIRAQFVAFPPRFA